MLPKINPIRTSAHRLNAAKRQTGGWRADLHCTLAPRIYEGGARRARGVPHPDAEKFLFEAVCPDFGLKQLPGWVCSSPPSVRTGVLRIIVRLPLAIVYYRFAARSTTPRKRGEQGLRPVSLSNTNLSFRTDVCLTSFRGAISADRITDRTETHWLRALPAKFQFACLLRRVDIHLIE